MEINSRLQNKHIQNNDKWVIIQHIEKDICFLFHQLSSYSYIMGDLYFTELYNLPYWDYINCELPIRDDDELCFFKEGCLVLILAMAWEQIDGAGCYINDKIETVLYSLNRYQPLNEKQCELHDIVTLAVNYAKNPNKDIYEEIVKKSIWVHREFIREYFKNKADNFVNNPYFK